MDKKPTIYVEDVKKSVELANEFIEGFVTKIDPRKYEDDHNSFVQLTLTAISMISSTMLDKLSGTWHTDRKELLKEHLKKMKLALKWVDFKNEKTP